MLAEDLPGRREREILGAPVVLSRMQVSGDLGLDVLSLESIAIARPRAARPKGRPRD